MTMLQVMSREMDQLYLSAMLLIAFTLAELIFQSFKFNSYTRVDIWTKYSLIVFLTLATSFIDESLSDAEEIRTQQNSYASISTSCIALSSTYVTYEVGRWIQSLFRLRASRVARSAQTLLRFRDVVASQTLLSDQDVLSTAELTSDFDLQR